MPPATWPALVDTNPNKRRGYGLIVHKEAFWLAGGRPVIYTEHPTNRLWPIEEKYRLVRTDPLSDTNYADWMHEKEWRVRGPLLLNQPAIAERFPLAWWWPCVALDQDVWEVWNVFPGISQVFSLEKGNTYVRPAPGPQGG